MTMTNIGETREEINLGLQHVIRRLRGCGYEIEYWGVVELHKSMRPHMHLVQRGSYIPKKAFNWAVRAEGWGHNDIRKVTTGWSAARYCAKHLCHSHQRRWPGRLIRFSRGFLLDQEERLAREQAKSDMAWHMVFGRADCVTGILQSKGFEVEMAPLGDDVLMGERPNVAGETWARRRTGRMGYGIQSSAEIDELAAKNGAVRRGRSYLRDLEKGLEVLRGCDAELVVDADGVIIE